MQDKRAHLNDHIEASVDDHLELTWSSLADTRQELDNMKDLQQKFYQMQDLNQKLTDSMAHCREEVRDLTLAVKSLEIQNIQQKKWMEDKEECKRIAGRLYCDSLFSERGSRFKIGDEKPRNAKEFNGSEDDKGIKTSGIENGRSSSYSWCS